MHHLDAALITQEVIEICYRPYLSDDLEGPQMDHPIILILSEVEVDLYRIKGRARMVDVGNRRFPGENYTAERFLGLVW